MSNDDNADVLGAAPTKKRQGMGALFGTDPVKEKDGVVIAYGLDLRVRLARAGGANPRFSKVAEEKSRPYRRMAEQEMLPREVDEAVTREIFAEAVVLEWSGAFDDDGELAPVGESIPFSKENVVKAFEKWPEFFAFVIAESRRLANYRKAQLEAERGN
jgi:hypothetical protein